MPLNHNRLIASHWTRLDKYQETHDYVMTIGHDKEKRVKATTPIDWVHHKQ